MKKASVIFLVAFIAVFGHLSDGLAFNYDLIGSYNNLFQFLSPKMKIDQKELREFNELVDKYLAQGKTEFGPSALYYSSQIAIVNGSLLVGYASGKKRGYISSDDVHSIRKYYETLYKPLYTYLVPTGMINRYPEYVLDYNILPVYQTLVKFTDVRSKYLDFFELSKIPKAGQLFMLKATTGFASGISLAEGRKLLQEGDLKKAKAISCEYYPKCGKMLAENLVKFNEEYQKEIRRVHLQR